jgi:hypothetical protein
MRMFAHIFNTWALAQLLHPLLFLFYLVVMGSTAVEFWIGWIFFIFFFSVFASIPSLLMAWILFYIAWFVSAVAAILLNFILVSLAVDRIIDGKTFYILPPAMAAVVSSILIRLRSFFQFQLTYKLDS